MLEFRHEVNRVAASVLEGQVWPLRLCHPALYPGLYPGEGSTREEIKMRTQMAEVMPAGLSRSRMRCTPQRLVKNMRGYARILTEPLKW